MPCALASPQRFNPIPSRATSARHRDRHEPFACRVWFHHDVVLRFSRPPPRATCELVRRPLPRVKPSSDIVCDKPYSNSRRVHNVSGKQFAHVVDAHCAASKVCGGAPRIQRRRTSCHDRAERRREPADTRIRTGASEERRATCVDAEKAERGLTRARRTRAEHGWKRCQRAHSRRAGKARAEAARSGGERVKETRRVAKR